MSLNLLPNLIIFFQICQPKSHFPKRFASKIHRKPRIEFKKLEPTHKVPTHSWKEFKKFTLSKPIKICIRRQDHSQSNCADLIPTKTWLCRRGLKNQNEAVPTRILENIGNVISYSQRVLCTSASEQLYTFGISSTPYLEDLTIFHDEYLDTKIRSWRTCFLFS